MSTTSQELDQKQAVTTLRRKDLLGIAELSPEEIELILDTAEAMKEVGTRPIKKVPALRGKTVVNLFYEPSTRTRTSFEIAEKRLSADTLNIAIGTSSVVKGETLADTALNLEAMSPDMIVLRHASSGACHFLSRVCRSAIINAGDGMHEHPTQALLDAFTIRERKKKLAGLKIAIVGDLLHVFRAERGMDAFEPATLGMVRIVGASTVAEGFALHEMALKGLLQSPDRFRDGNSVCIDASVFIDSSEDA